MSLKTRVHEIWPKWFVGKPDWDQAYDDLEAKWGERATSALESMLAEWMADSGLEGRAPTPAELRAVIVGNVPDWIRRNYKHVEAMARKHHTRMIA